VEPRRQELLGQRESAREALQNAEVRRKGFAGSVDDSELRIYESIRVGGRRQAVATLTPDGACGHCFSMIPLQIQNEVRHGASLIRCEACGVILAAPHAEGDAEEDGDAPASRA
jgi:predicted  nucleic acid-binding Zn-ribbon protein